MTEAVFLKVLNMAVSAGYLIAAVLVLRLLLRRAPRWVHCLLWGIVALRLVCPFSLESVLSLIPSKEVVSPTIVTSPAPQIQTGLPAVDGSLNPVIGQTLTPAPAASVNPAQVAVTVAAWVWVAGAVLLLLVATVSYWRLRRRVAEATPLKDNVFQCQNLPTTFILGIFKPRIYISYNISEEHLPLVLAHEQAHLHRRDHWIKPLAYLLLAVYWFHPLMWVAYILLCRDIELACDQRVMRTLGADTRRAYAEALLYNGVHSRRIAACPLAFGEVGIKERVKSVMHYKKPAFWIVLVAVVACVVVAVCFLTSPKPTPTITGYGTADEDITIRVTELELEGDDPHITLRWENESEEMVMLSGATSLWHEDTQQTAGTAFPALSFREHELEAGASSTETYDLRNYAFNQAGSYRLEMRYSYPLLDAFSTAWVTFTVPEELAERLSLPTTARELDLFPEGTGHGFTQVTDEAFWAKYGYHVYYYDFEKVEVQLGGSRVDLAAALRDGTVTVEKLLEYAQTVSGTGEHYSHILRDDGTVIHQFPTYALIKQNSLDGKQHCFIGPPGLEFEMLENFSPAGVQVTSYTLSVQPNAQAALRRLTDESFRVIHGFDVYTYGLETVQVETEQGMQDLKTLLKNGSVTAEMLVTDARQRADNGEVQKESYKDGGSELFRFDTYTLIKANSLDGDRNLYILAPGYDLNDVQPDVAAQMTVDVTGDGVDESILVRLLGTDPYAGSYDLDVVTPEGNLLWRESFSGSHVGWNTLFVCATEEGNYLLRYNPYISTGLGFYSYTLFRPENGQEVIKNQREIEFDLNGRQPFDVPEMVAFAEEVGALLENSYLLVSTNREVAGLGMTSGPFPGSMVKIYRFLDTVDIYAEGDDLATKLQKYSDYMMATEGTPGETTTTAKPTSSTSTTAPTKTTSSTSTTEGTRGETTTTTLTKTTSSTSTTAPTKTTSSTSTTEGTRGETSTTAPTKTTSSTSTTEGTRGETTTTTAPEEDVTEQANAVFKTKNITCITFYAYYGMGTGSEVPAENMAEITRWLGSFTIDRKVGDDVLPPGTNTVYVEIAYANGTVVKRGLDTAMVDGIAYYTKRDEPPECLGDILSRTSIG